MLQDKHLPRVLGFEFAKFPWRLTETLRQPGLYLVNTARPSAAVLAGSLGAGLTGAAAVSPAGPSSAAICQRGLGSSRQQAC